MKDIRIYETKPSSGMLLHANELPFNISEEMLHEIQEAITKLEFQRYPDSKCKQLKEAYAKVMNLSSEQLIVGNGSDELLGLLIGAYLGKGKLLYTLALDFSMYDYYAGMYDAKVLKFAGREDGSYSANDFIEYGRQNKVDMIMISNPNNPTGFALSNAKLRLIVEAFPQIPIVIDEAYGEFYDESMLTYIDRYTNLYVTRTLSKAYGLAGMRLGFVAGNKKTIAELSKKKVPYSVNAFSQLVGCIALKHADEYQAYVATIKEERNKLYQSLKPLSFLQVYRSNANYLYGRSMQAAAFVHYLAKHGVIIRSYGDDTFRITIGNKEQNKRVVQLCNAFEKGAVL